jgi:hypothetical protein
VYGGEDGVERLIATGRDAAATQARTGTPQLATAASLTDSTAVMFGVPYYTEPARGSCRRGATKSTSRSGRGG